MTDATRNINVMNCGEYMKQYTDVRKKCAVKR